MYVYVSAFQCLYFKVYLYLCKEFSSFNEASVSACKVISTVIKKNQTLWFAMAFRDSFWFQWQFMQPEDYCRLVMG